MATVNIDDIKGAMETFLKHLPDDMAYATFYGAMQNGQTDLLWSTLKDANIPGLAKRKDQFLEQAKQMGLCKEIENMIMQFYGDRIQKCRNNAIDKLSDAIKSYKGSISCFQ